MRPGYKSKYQPRSLGDFDRLVPVRGQPAEADSQQLYIPLMKVTARPLRRTEADQQSLFGQGCANARYLFVADRPSRRPVSLCATSGAG